jgi:bacterioferritin
MSITPYTDEALVQSEVNQAINRGPLTAAYQADVDWVIDELNRLRATEIASYLQYKQHSYMAVSMLSPGIRGDFEEHAAAELDHADRLARRIQQLGGVPIYNQAELAARAADIGVHPEQAPTLTDMVIANLMVERQQIEAYTNTIRQISDGDLVTRQILLGILAETEGHAAELSDYLKLRSEMR